MASVEAAAALLTAESIVVAGLSLMIQNRHVDLKGEKHLQHGFIGAGVFLGISFIVSLIYLHVAEYPEGMFGSFYPAQYVLTAALLSLLLAVYLGFGGLYLAQVQHRSR